MKFQKSILALIIGSSFLFTACKCDKKEAAAVIDETIAEDSLATETPVVMLDADGNYLYNIGTLIDLTLPDGKVINVGENSFENKLFTQLNDANFKVSEDKSQGWITLDRVYFATGKSALTDKSENQVSNVIALLKAFPNTQIKVGGYTDNTGDAAINKQVSNERAQTVADQIIAGGIDKSRIASEGYGADHFVCPANDTDECKAQNRRVDIRVTKK